VNIYLDWNATTPPLPEVVKRMVEAAETAWGNPSSIHSDGRRARRFVEEARIAVGELTGADPKDIVLTGGGTEANNLALRSALKDATYTLLTSRMEHPSVTKVAEWHAARGGAVHWLRVKADGCVDLDDIARALTKEKCVLALQAVNHETGVIQPVEEALLLAKKVNAHTHVDAVQAYGKIAVNYAADTQTIGAHKIRGPKGIGALIHLPHVRIEPVLVGGAQEKGLRPGTSDPVAAAGFAVAVRHAASGPARYKKVAALRDRFEGGSSAPAGRSSKGWIGRPGSTRFQHCVARLGRCGDDRRARSRRGQCIEWERVQRGNDRSITGVARARRGRAGTLGGASIDGRRNQRRRYRPRDRSVSHRCVARLASVGGGFGRRAGNLERDPERFCAGVAAITLVAGEAE